MYKHDESPPPIGDTIQPLRPTHGSRLPVTLDTITILISILGATIALATFILRTSAHLEGRIERLEVGQADLRERMARLEGLFEGFIRREGGATASAAS